MEPAELIRTFWGRIEARDWPGVAALLDDDLVVEWPVSAERIVGPANFVRVNAEYPEGWSIRVQRIVAEGDTVVSEVEVPHTELGLFAAMSVWTVRDGRIVRGREYWTSVGSETPPGWREPFTERI